MALAIFLLSKESGTKNVPFAPLSRSRGDIRFMEEADV